MLTKEAFNALLKTLEEPPSHVVFIMATTDVYKVPITITSRAQTFTFKLADNKTMFDFLKSVVQKEKIPIDDEALQIIVKRGGGSFRDSLSLLDQISTLSDQKITSALVLEALGLPQDEAIQELLAAYVSQNVAQVSDCLKNLLNSGVKAETIADEIIRTIIASPQPELMLLLAKLPEVKAPYAEAKILVALIEPTTAPIRPVAPTVKESRPITSVAKEPEPATPVVKMPEPATPVVKEPEPATPPNKKNPAPASSPVVSDFDWQAYLDKVQALSDAVYSQLLKTQHEFDGAVLHIYPVKRIVRTILTRENNKKILFSAISNNVKITIHEISDSPTGEKKDETIAKISDIMGGEVINDGGTSPF